MEAPTAGVDELLRAVIEQKRLVRLVYKDKPRTIELHDYGIDNGSVKLLAFQVGGARRGGFRTGDGWK